jgi:hypothetical protein
MVYSLSYRRPAYVSRSSVGSSDGVANSDASLNSGKSCTIAGIPDALSFDKIVNGGTCPVSYHIMLLFCRDAWFGNTKCSPLESMSALESGNYNTFHVTVYTLRASNVS